MRLRAENERLREQFRRTKNPAVDRAGGGAARGYRGAEAARGRAGGWPQGSPLRGAEIGAHGIKNLAMLGDAVRTPAAAMGWKNYYEAGRAGIAMERVGEIRGAPQVAFAAYSAGENDRAAQAQTGLQAAERGSIKAERAEGVG